MEAHMLKLQNEFSEQENPSQSSGNPECDNQPLHRKIIMLVAWLSKGVCINMMAIARRTQSNPDEAHRIE